MRKIQFDMYLENITLLLVMSDMLIKITRKSAEKTIMVKKYCFVHGLKKFNADIKSKSMINSQAEMGVIPSTLPRNVALVESILDR